jgi:DNA polymerase III subunit delta'
MNKTESSVSDALAVKLPWQNEQWSKLLQMYTGQRLPHALLFAGPAGVGKYRFALALAHYLMCNSPVDGMPCGSCRQCGFNKAATHPDLKLIAPEEKGKQIKVDQIRELVGFVCQTSQQGGSKVIILSPAESMNINAANALLKSLEEPTPGTLMILLTHAPSQLLATIRSRCQSMVFPVPASEQAMRWLVPLVSSEEQAAQLLKEAAGQPMTALVLLETDGISRFQQMDSDFLAMLGGRQLALSLAQKWIGYDLSDSLVWLARRIAGLVRYRCAGAELEAQWQPLVLNADLQRLFKLSDAINKLHGKVSRGANPNQQLALEELLLESCDVFQGN